MLNHQEHSPDADYVLCQDCGHADSYSDEKHRGRVKCSCGGEFCGCACCSGIARLSKQFASDPSGSESLAGLPVRESGDETG